MATPRFAALLCAVSLVACGPEDHGSPGNRSSADDGSGAQAQLQTQLSARGFDARSVTLQAAPAGRGTFYRVFWQGRPIFGLGGKAVPGESTASFPNVRYAPNVQVVTTPRLSESEASEIASTKLPGARVDKVELGLEPVEEERPGASESAEPDRVVVSLELVYRVVLRSPGRFDPGYVAVVDALSGELKAFTSGALELAAEYQNATEHGLYSGVRHGLVGYYADDPAPYSLEDVNGNSFYLEDGYSVDSGGHPHRSTFPCNSTTPSFGDGRPYAPSSGVHSVNGQTAAADAFTAVQQTWLMFGTVLNQIGPDGHGNPLSIILHDQAANDYFFPTIRTLTIGYVSLTGKTLLPFATTDIVAHELGHDFFTSNVYVDPADPGIGVGQPGALNEATGDIIGFLTELLRDASSSSTSGGLLDPSRNTIDTYVPTAKNFTIGEDAYPNARSMLTPPVPFWSSSLGLGDNHDMAGPLDRMFLLLAYGCARTTALSPPNSPRAQWTCDTVLNGSTGVKPRAAALIWQCAVEHLTPRSGVFDARRVALDTCAHADDGHYGGPHTTAVADAFAGVHIGPPADTTPPTASLSCQQGKGTLDCTVAIDDAENPNRFEQAPTLTLDGTTVVTLAALHTVGSFPTASLSSGAHTVVLNGWDLWNNPVQQTATATLDKTGPLASVTVTGPPKQPLVTVFASDTAGIDKVEFREGAALLGWTTAAPYDFTPDVANWSDGTHPLTITVLDNFANATVLSATVQVDNTPPLVQASVSSVGPPYAVSATASDASPLIQAQLKVDGLLLGTDTSAPYQWNYVPLDPLAHNLTVEVTDSFGNVGRATLPAPRDTQPPAAVFFPHQSGAIVRIDVTLADTCGLLLPFDFYLDGVPTASITSASQTVTLLATLSVGSHVASIAVADGCGNSALVSSPFEKEESIPGIAFDARDDSTPKMPVFTIGCFSDIGVQRAEARLAGSPIAVDTTAPYQLTIDSSTWADGTKIVEFQCFDTNGVGSDVLSANVTADNTGPTFILSVHGAGHQWTVSPDSLADFHDIASVKMLGGLGGFSVTKTSPPWPYLYVIPSSITINTPFPFAGIATDAWGNQTSHFYYCDIDTTNNTVRYLNCTEE